MKQWEKDLQQQYEQDRRRLLDYREIDIEFKQLMMEATILDGPVEPDPVIDIVLDDRIHDGERIWAKQDKNSDREIVGSYSEECEQCSTEHGGQEVIDDYDDSFDSYYDEIVKYKNSKKNGKKKKGK